jgi:hypothetical protein
MKNRILCIEEYGVVNETFDFEEMTSFVDD